MAEVSLFFNNEDNNILSLKNNPIDVELKKIKLMEKVIILMLY
jgi:hypothetical protein